MTFAKTLTKVIGAATLLAGVVALSNLTARAEEEQPNPTRQQWTFAGAFGKYDKAQLQRGFKIYKEVCSNCHELHIPIRTLAQPGGPELSVDEVKALAASYTVKDGPNSSGEMFDRPGRPSDYFPAPFANPEAAAAALGSAPPDMSLLAKARKYERGFPAFVFDALPVPGGMYQELGPDYIYAILHGYEKDEDPNWNAYFPGHKIAMAKPLTDGQVDYTDGTPATLDQYAKDVASFLYWAAEPTLEDRKSLGVKVMIFLLVLSCLMYFTKRTIWSDVAH
ncbi:ubiquinol-cytochrome c reductase cytochrome c1 subunit [Rhodoblastus acidophilus]|uniref:Cytochrome c1 n=1 Tax=Rhodoblastus acidophilus TaxID=1074 RepID=A0A212RW66_RHOAC|nr:cytochrome c1 [Rhodoblastus acidophilus]MCW2315161.1 cytochrome c1 [Rhodoblastus acidophilus]PPQ38347.1 cytochrome c1 [Rhodoblastus acidophilus]RAI18881.1 cytochrome c1 [Rhodoblastus acidophilus]SNB76876.1 ubiquinol-cytochrome c reductase cytochrome c1 subunit [Rhodoblastus acidophilus]